MAEKSLISGFSKLTREEKIQWLAAWLNDADLQPFLDQFRLTDGTLQERFDSFSENTLSNYHLPWGMVPNVLIDDQVFHVPVVIEESSVVAAASKAAAFWAKRGGFKTLSVATLKKGQLHFTFDGNRQLLLKAWDEISQKLRQGVSSLTSNMEARGGGITSLQLISIAGLPSEYCQLELEAETRDSMGANFINSILEEFGRILPGIIQHAGVEGNVEIIMAILSNYTPQSRITMQLEAPVGTLQWHKEMSASDFARRMKWAADIAWHDTGRAVTHNKGIYNGVDAVVLATGNDFRAVEAAGHAWAARDGKYRSLSTVEINDGIFHMQLDIPLALGTVGGLTNLHPLAARSLQILGNPSAQTLMKVAAAVGMANNFAAMASLVTTGIQQGHMKMHLQNILNALQVSPQMQPRVVEYFSDRTVSVAAVRDYVATLKG
ncbi:MAG: hypothetical protein ACK4VN_06565 [Bacteroidales bacterium]